MVESLIRRYFTVFCCEDFSVNRFCFRINNGRWSDTSVKRIPESNLLGFVINISSIKVIVLSVIRYGLALHHEWQRK